MNKLYLCHQTIESSTPLELIDIAASCGYDGIGLRLYPSPVPTMKFHPVVGDANLIGEIKARLASTKLGVIEILSFYLQPQTNLDDFLPALNLAAELGAENLLVQGDDTDWNRLVDKFGRLCDMTSKLGLTPMIEFAPPRPVATLRQAVQLVKAAGRSNAGILIDSVLFVMTGELPKNLLGLDKKLFPYVQINDAHVEPDDFNPPRKDRLGGLGKRRALPGEGNLPLKEILAGLAKDIPISVEMAIKPADMADRDWAKINLAAMKKFLAS